MRIYHGSKKIVTMPFSDHKNVIRDFGDGFYATENEELVRDWAAPDVNGGFVNIYELETEDLNIIDLSSSRYSVLNWLALILKERRIVFDSAECRRNAESLIRRYLPEISAADIIKGSRADDANLIYCKAFIEEKIEKDELSGLIEKAGLGEQLVLRTEKALNSLEYISSEAVDGMFYYSGRLMKEKQAAGLLLPSSASDPMAPYPKTYLKYASDLLGRSVRYISGLRSSLPYLTPELFLKCFIVSGYAGRFENGDPSILLGTEYHELCQRILLSCGIEPDGDMEYEEGPDSAVAYWCGAMLVCHQWYKGTSFANILSSLSYSRLFALYPELHTLTFKEASDAVDSRLKSRRSDSTSLQTYRKRFGLSQRELAEASGINLRTLQQYETGSKNINRAAAEKIISLSHIFHCRPEAMLH